MTSASAHRRRIRTASVLTAGVLTLTGGVAAVAWATAVKPPSLSQQPAAAPRVATTDPATQRLLRQLAADRAVLRDLRQRIPHMVGEIDDLPRPPAASFGTGATSIQIPSVHVPVAAPAPAPAPPTHATSGASGAVR
jgi:hypothetical protein